MKMKILKKIKLINWHYFINETIKIERNVLLTGENGTGKSTILDAIQYVLTAGKPKFNTAANEKASRDLIGYVRCKTGYDKHQYARSGDVTSHIALEFFDENKNNSFIIGTVIDSASNLSYPKYIFYRIEDKKVEDGLYIENDIPRNINNFQAYIKNFKSTILKTQEQARKDFCHRFGSINHRFIDLIPKALAFRPINNIKDFVFSYLLDKKEVHMDYLKENIRTLTEFENLLKQVKLKVKQLEEIESIYDNINQVKENHNIQDYIIKRLDKEINLMNIENKQKEYQQLKFNKELAEKKKQNVSFKLEEEREFLNDLKNMLATNDNYQLLKELQRDKKNLSIKLEELKDKEKILNNHLNQLYSSIYRLYEQGISITGMESVYQYRNIEINEENIQEYKNTLVVFSMELEKYKQNLYSKQARIKHQLELTQEELEKVENDIKTLERKKLIYPDYVTKLKIAIETEVSKELGKNIEAKILCELLYIKDESWQNAIEGYLNTQRFSLVVEPEYFDLSLKIYEKVKYALNIHTTGLINTQKLDIYQDDKENSLSYIIGSENQYAKNYINMLLNNVICCENVEDLKKYPVSITKTCMVYKNRTARQIKKEVYDTHFIGQDAYKKQLIKKIHEKDILLNLRNDYNEQLRQIDSLLRFLNDIEFTFIETNLDLKLDIQRIKHELVEKENKINEIDNSTFIDIEVKIKEADKLVNDLKLEEERLNRKIGGLSTSIENKIDEIKNVKNDQVLIDNIFIEIENVIFPVLNKAQARYEDAIKNRDFITVKTNYERQLANSKTRINNLISDLSIKQTEYNRDHHFGAAVGIEGIDTFLSELHKLKTSQIMVYEEKIREARKKAEAQFQDEFLSKLQENIINAQREFDKLNDALKDITFGEDKYLFVYYDDKNNKKIYDMIMDNSNIGGNSLFSASFREKHKEAIDELFEQISLDTEESQRALEKYTDYRNYMDYDIKIINKNGETASFSKIGREKSGGETQTPYYVAIAASFLQLYKSTFYDSIGLILFDEAFDKMDETRIESMMTFLNKLDLQVILASPPQKIETIAPYVETTLIVNREGDNSFIVAFYHE